MPSINARVEEAIESPNPIRAPKVTPRIKHAEEKAVVSYEQWLQNEEDYLLDVYEHIQRMNMQCGRQLFDRETCDFSAFCNIAYRYSFKYKKKDAYIYDETNYLADENADTYVFE